jgi:excisionase family DNA binding protein
MSVTEAAEKIGVSASKVYQLVAARRIAHYRVGGKILFSEADVDAYLASCRVGAVTPVATAPRVQIKLKHLRLS